MVELVLCRSGFEVRNNLGRSCIFWRLIFIEVNLFTFSIQAIETAKVIPLNLGTLKSILRELYEGLREYCEAIGYLRGYTFLDHELIGFFLRDVLKEQSFFAQFDRCRRLWYGAL